MGRSEKELAHQRQQRAVRSRMIAYGRWRPFVDAGPARERLRELGAAGVGWKQAADLAGLSYATVSGLLFGQHGRPPAGRIRAKTEAAVLAVQVSPERLSPGTRIDATGTRRRIQALVASGRPVSEIARQLDREPRLFRRVLSQPTVTVRTASEVRALCSQVGEGMPETDSRYARAARRMAARHGWPPLSAWESGDIDRPEAQPIEGWQEWQRRVVRGPDRWAAVAEDAEFVAREEGLTTRSEIAERLGLTENNLTQLLNRAERARTAETERVHEAQRAQFAEAAAQVTEPMQLEAEAG